MCEPPLGDVAVRLSPDTANTPLNGTLDPLHLSFASGQPVYPMRLPRLARTPQSLGLVLAAHRMETRSAIGGERPRVTYAGRVTVRSGPPAGPAAGTPFLTAIGQEFPHASSISGDHVLRQASADTPFQQVIYEDHLRKVAGIPARLLTVVGTFALAVTAVTMFAVRRSRRPVPAPPTVHAPPPISRTRPS